MNRAFAFFGTKTATFLCLITAIISRVINVCFVSYVSNDKIILALQSKSLLLGHGLSRPLYYLINLEVPVYDYTPMWPPGYPLLLAPLLKIFHYDVYWATLVLDIIISVAFILIVRKLCRQLDFPASVVNIATLITGCFEYTFIHDSNPTDTISLALLLLGFISTIKLLINKEFNKALLIKAGILLFLPCLFRYNYTPIVLMISGLILISGFIKKDALLKRKGWWLSFITALLILSLFLILKRSTGMMNYIMETERGLFPENIFHWFPVVPSSFINVAFLTSQLIQKINLPFNSSMLLLEIINVFILISLALLFIYLLVKKRYFVHPSPFKWFLLLGFLTSLIVFLTLGALSFTHQIQGKSINAPWNYVYESRYYAFVYVFIQLSFLGLFSLNGRAVQKKFNKIIFWSCMGVLIIEIGHNIYFNTKVAFHYQEYKSRVFVEQENNYFHSLLSDLIKEYPGYEILVADPNDSYYYHMATYLGNKGIVDAGKLKTGQPLVKKNSILLLRLIDMQAGDYKNCLLGSNVTLIKKINVFNYYLIVLHS